MPRAWSKKDERMYEHILDSCRGSERTCKRIAAATVNKKRRLEGRTLGDLVLESKRRSSNDPETGGWVPGWQRRNDPHFATKEAAQAAVTKSGMHGALYRVCPSDSKGKCTRLQSPPPYRPPTSTPPTLRLVLASVLSLWIYEQFIREKSGEVKGLEDCGCEH